MIQLLMATFKPKEVISILQKLGFAQKRQTGSHVIMYNPSLVKTIPIPMHGKDLKEGTLKAIIKQAQSEEKTFLKLKKATLFQYDLEYKSGWLRLFYLD